MIVREHLIEHGRVLQRVAGVYPSERPKRDDDALIVRDHDFHMFVEDVGNRITYARGVAEVGYTLEGADFEGERALAKAISPVGRERAGLARAVQAWMARCWSDLAWFGLAVYEVARIVRVSEEGERIPDGFRLFRVDPRQVGRRWGWAGAPWWQLTSERDRSELGLGNRVRLDDAWFAVMELPADLAKVMREASRGLRGGATGAVGRINPWSHGDHYAAGYRLGEHDETRKALMARVTRETGWSGRGGFNDRVTSHYLVRRTIRTARFSLRLRMALVDLLNGLLVGPAASHHTGGAVRVQKELDLAEIDAAELALDRGSASFRSISKRVGW